MQKTTWLAVVIFLGAISALAEEAPRGDVAAGYSFLHFGTSGNGNVHGGSFNLAWRCFPIWQSTLAMTGPQSET